MFPVEVYKERRDRLKRDLKSGLVFLPGNKQSPMNYPDNSYPFRQDSSFLYFFGLDLPSLAAVIDIDNNADIIFGDDLTIDQIVWTKPLAPLSQQALAVGVNQTLALNQMQSVLSKAVKSKRTVHLLPQYRPENILKIQQLLNIGPAQLNEHISEQLIKAIVAQRSYKSNLEIEQIEIALDVTYRMQMAAMKTVKPDVSEKEVAGKMTGIAISMGSDLSFPIILSVRGETLHNHTLDNVMQSGDIAVNDCGAESPMHYAGDITRTIPVSGKFTSRQKDVYSIVLSALQKAIEAVKPGVPFKDIHLLACEKLIDGLKGLGLMKGDTKEAVAAGGHALFFPCGLGHMMGLDVHDMEPLGEDYVGYSDSVKRSSQFGLSALRLARELEPGFVITIEPGLYFNPRLIDSFKAQKKFTDYINYDTVEKYKDFGGIRIEDDVLVTDTASQVLGKPIPKTINDIETICSTHCS